MCATKYLATTWWPPKKMKFALKNGIFDFHGTEL